MHFATAFFESSPLFLKAAAFTLGITALALVIAVPVGLFFSLMSLAKTRWIRSTAHSYVYLVRGTPLIVQIFILYFGLTNLIQIPGFLAASIALAFHNGAYIAEIFRGSINSISRGQFEAAYSIGMGPGLAYRRIILPQAFKRAIPSLGNQFIIALKDSSLAAFISINELFNVATTLGSNNFDQMTYLLVVSVYYLLLVLAFTQMVRFLENRYAFAE